MAPLTNVFPKPLVPIGGMPILEIVIRQLRHHGFRHITLAVGYLADLIKAYFQDGAKWDMKIDYSYETIPLGTAGPLALIEGLNDTFLVMNADILSNIDYSNIIQVHKAHGGLATIGAYQRQFTVDLGVIIPDGTGCIIDYVEKPTNTFMVSMGVYVFEPQILDFIKGKDYLDFPDLVKILLKQDIPVHYHLFDGYWLDIGRHEDYAKAALEFETLQATYNFL